MQTFSAAFLLLLGLTAAHAQPLPPLDLAALPAMDAPGRSIYEHRFLLGNLPRAWAISANGKYGGHWGGGTPESARVAALKSCADKGGTDCQIYVEDLRVVWPGRAAPPPPAPPGPLIAESGYGFVPDARFFWYGPEKAAGVLVWAHGYGGPLADYRGWQPPPFTRAFNNAGYDIVRFERDPTGDIARERVAGWMHAGLSALRQRGWHRVIVAGQSRGAFNAMEMLTSPVPPADVVIALSPAAHGTDPGSRAMFQQADNWTLVHNAAAPRMRLAWAQFVEDPYAADEDRRAALLREDLTPRIGALLLIDRPEGLKGHGAGQSVGFAERFGACLLRFATATPPPAGC